MNRAVQRTHIPTKYFKQIRSIHTWYRILFITKRYIKRKMFVKCIWHPRGLHCFAHYKYHVHVGQDIKAVRWWLNTTNRYNHRGVLTLQAFLKQRIFSESRSYPFSRKGNLILTFYIWCCGMDSYFRLTVVKLIRENYANGNTRDTMACYKIQLSGQSTPVIKGNGHTTLKL